MDRYVNTCMRYAESVVIGHRAHLNSEQAERIKQFAKNLQQGILNLQKAVHDQALDEDNAKRGVTLVLSNPGIANEMAGAFIEAMRLLMRELQEEGITDEMIETCLPAIAPAVAEFVIKVWRNDISGEFIRYCIRYCQDNGLTRDSDVALVHKVRDSLMYFSKLLFAFYISLGGIRGINEEILSHAFRSFQPFFPAAVHVEQILVACEGYVGWGETLEKILSDATAPSTLLGKEMVGPPYYFWFFLHYPVYAAELANVLSILEKMGASDSEYALLKEFLSNKDNQYMLPLVLEALKLSIASGEPVNLVRALSHPAQVIEQSRQASWMSVRSSAYHSSFFNSSEEKDRGKEVIEKVKGRQWVCTNTANTFCFFSRSRHSSGIGVSVMMRTVAFMHKISPVEAMIIKQTLQQMSLLLASRPVADVSEVEGLAQQCHVLGS